MNAPSGTRENRDPSRRILIIFNPAAGGTRRARLAQVLDCLRARGCALEVVETTAPGHAVNSAREADLQRFDVIAAAGGDGTINEVVNGLAGKDVPLGIIPLGTANTLAREIGLARRPDAVADALAAGATRAIHLGRTNGRRFVMMAGIGFDAAAVKGVSRALKRRVGPMAYIWEALRQIFVYAFTPFDVTIDGKKTRTVSSIVCRGRHYGGPFVAAPAASLHDSTFQVVLLDGRGWWNVLRYGFGLLFRCLPAVGNVRILPGREIVVESQDGLPVQADGDLIGALPMRLAIDPEPVRLIYPA